MSRLARAAPLLGCTLVVVALALVPRPADSPLGRVANVDGDGPDPRFDVALDAAALRRAGELVPDDSTYLAAAPGASPLVQGNLKAAAQLYLAPSLPVQGLNEADWVLAYLDVAPDTPATRLGSKLWLLDARARR